MGGGEEISLGEIGYHKCSLESPPAWVDTGSSGRGQPPLPASRHKAPPQRQMRYPFLRVTEVLSSEAPSCKPGVPPSSCQWHIHSHSHQKRPPQQRPHRGMLIALFHAGAPSPVPEASSSRPSYQRRPPPQQGCPSLDRGIILYTNTDALATNPQMFSQQRLPSLYQGLHNRTFSTPENPSPMVQNRGAILIRGLHTRDALFHTRAPSFAPQAPFSASKTPSSAPKLKQPPPKKGRPPMVRSGASFTEAHSSSETFTTGAPSRPPTPP